MSGTCGGQRSGSRDQRGNAREASTCRPCRPPDRKMTRSDPCYKKITVTAVFRQRNAGGQLGGSISHPDGGDGGQDQSGVAGGGE